MEQTTKQTRKVKLDQILATCCPMFNNRLAASGKETIVSELDGSYDEVYKPLHLMFAARDFLDNYEDCNHIRQLLPYVVVRDTDGRIAMYQRTSKGTEFRLQNNLSIGFGGHIDISDLVLQDVPNHNLIDVRATIMQNVATELGEELSLFADNMIPDVESANRHVHIISNAGAVNRVHLAIVFSVTVRDISVLRIEDELNFIGWFNQGQLLSEFDLGDFEVWTQALLGIDLSTVPALPLP
jgi:predicted NUDIX family phosphoesterase